MKTEKPRGRSLLAGDSLTPPATRTWTPKRPPGAHGRREEWGDSQVRGTSLLLTCGRKGKTWPRWYACRLLSGSAKSLTGHTGDWKAAKAEGPSTYLCQENLPLYGKGSRYLGRARAVPALAALAELKVVFSSPLQCGSQPAPRMGLSRGGRRGGAGGDFVPPFVRKGMEAMGGHQQHPGRGPQTDSRGGRREMPPAGGGCHGGGGADEGVLSARTLELLAGTRCFLQAAPLRSA